MDDYQSFKDKKLADEINEIARNLEQVEKNDIRTMQEYVFVNVFLPMFAGDEELMYDVNIGTWINYAGGPFKSVQIIDRNNVVLFTVPPVLDNNAMNPLLAKGHPLSHIVATANQYAQFHPSQGFNYLTAELETKAVNTKTTDDYRKELETWNTIFKRYNRQLIAEIKQTTINQINAKTDLNCDFDLM